MNIFDLDWGKWTYGLFRALIGGGSAAVSGGIVISASDPADFNFGNTRIYKVMAAMFMINGLLSMFFYLRQNPLPEVITTVTTTETSVLGRPGPPASVTKVVEEKTTGTPPKE